MLKWILVILHILTAAAWFGLGLRLAGQARTVASGNAPALAEDAGRSVQWMNVFIVLTLVFAASAFVVGGRVGGSNPFSFYGPQYHTSLLLILVLTGLQFFVIRPGWNGLTGGDDTESARKRVAIGTGVGHLVWLVILVLMFWNRLLGSF
ncbi:MAG: hypothetical protein BRD44_07615 [Bacteroidetes bacterium QS_7_67_15]|nr:MAG: hypothetical protein BRD44_07615 [Bacteroidetes bacterium QS_7_67_15]